MQACPKCGSAAPDDAKTCPICFAALGDSTPAPSPPTAAPPQVGGNPSAPGLAPQGSSLPLQPLGAGPAVPREEEYMPIPGIPGVDNIPKDAPPVYGQPTAVPPIGLGTGQPRMTLGGDVIHEEALPHNFGQPIGGAPMGPSTLRQTAPAPIPPARRGSAPTRSASAESSRSVGFPVAVIVVALLLLLGGGAFGFWYWQKQQAPARAADQFMSALQKKDWKTVYQLMELPAEQKSVVTEQMFTSLMGFVGNMFTLKTYKIEGVTNNGDTATVKITATATTPAIMGQPAGDKTNTSEMPMKLVGGKWKVDATSARGSMPGFGDLGGMGGAGAPGRK